jgi:hypothetical protein
MSTVNNLTQINLTNGTDAREFFNNYFNNNIDIPSNVNNAIISFFESIADNKESALALSAAVLYTSQMQQLNPMEVLEQFSKMSKGELGPYLCMFLNYNRVGTSLLGNNNKPIGNKYIQRNIHL